MKKLFTFILAALLLVGAFQAAAAQSTSDLTITLSRDNGYGGTGEIQGIFSIHVKNPPESVRRVVFYIDETKMGEDTQAPFAYQFSTDNYPAGAHTVFAIGYGYDETQGLISNRYTTNFVPAADVPGKVLAMVGPLFIVIFGVVGLGFVIPMLMDRRKGKTPLGAQRNYGLTGGTICPKCSRPFALHPFKVNLVMGALDYCPHCGKWSMVRHVPLAALRAAEAAELANAGGEAQVQGQSEEDKLKKELDDSRFQNT